MRLTKPRSVVLAAVLVASGSLVTGSGPATASVPQTHDTKGCVILKNLTDKIVTYQASTPPPFGVGSTGNFYDELFDSAGAKVGSITGSSWVIQQRASDGHLLAYSQEEITLADGTIHTAGVYDFTNVYSGKWESGPAVGTSGKYLGMYGTRSAAVVIPTKLAKAAITLCPRP